MGKKQAKCSKKCEKHTLIFKTRHDSQYFPRQVQVSFCPTTKKKHPIFPIFNRDGKHYTTSFTLHEEKDKYEINDILYHEEHKRFCKEQLEGKSEMLQPKPRSKNQYCHVCKDRYEDYLDHISLKSHRDCLGNNKFSEHIETLIEIYFPNKKEQQPEIQLAAVEDTILEKGLSISTKKSSISQTCENLHENQSFGYNNKKINHQQNLNYEVKGANNNNLYMNEIQEKKILQQENQGKITSISSISEKNSLKGAKVKQHNTNNTILMGNRTI